MGICSTNHLFYRRGTSLQKCLEYVNVASDVVLNLPWTDLIDVEVDVVNECRAVHKDALQNHQVVLERLTHGIARGSDVLSAYLMNILAKFYHRNQIKASLVNSGVGTAVDRMLEENMFYLIGEFLDRGLEITSFPYYIANQPSMTAFLKKYQMELSLHLIRTCSWKEFNSVCQKYKLTTTKEFLRDRLIVFNLLPSHPLQSATHFNTNLAHLLGGSTQRLNLNELEETQLLSILRTLHSYYEDGTEFRQFSFDLEVQGAESTAKHFTINRDQYNQVIEMLNVSKCLFILFRGGVMG